MSDPKQLLKDELERECCEREWAETWKLSGPGDALAGALKGYDEATTDFGTYAAAHVRNDDGVLEGLRLMHSVLQKEWSEADSQKGDRLGAMYHGKRQPSKRPPLNPMATSGRPKDATAKAAAPMSSTETSCTANRRWTLRREAKLGEANPLGTPAENRSLAIRTRI